MAKASNKGGLIALLIILALVLSAVVVYASNQSKFTGNNNGGNNGLGGGIPTPPNNTGVPSEFPLKKGSNNAYVGKLQNYLMTVNSTCLPKYGADNDWGSETEACVFSVLGVHEVSWNTYKSLGLN